MPLPSFSEDPTAYRREYMRIFRLREDNKKYVQEYNKAYRLKHKDKRAEYDREYKKKNAERIKYLNKLERHRLKLDVFKYYSGGDVLNIKCAECGYNDIRALQLDHIDNNGAASRREKFGKRTVAGEEYYRWLRKNGYPDGYQVLCANCNVIKFKENIGAYYPDSVQFHS